MFFFGNGAYFWRTRINYEVFSYTKRNSEIKGGKIIEEEKKNPFEMVAYVDTPEELEKQRKAANKENWEMAISVIFVHSVFWWLVFQL